MNRNSKQGKSAFDDEKSDKHSHGDGKHQTRQKQSRKLSNKMSHSKMNNNEQKIIYHMHRNGNSKQRRDRNNVQSIHQMITGGVIPYPPIHHGGGSNAGRGSNSVRRRDQGPNSGHRRGRESISNGGSGHGSNYRNQRIGHRRRSKMSLYCANCLKTYRLKWPFLGPINWNEFSYPIEVENYVAHLPLLTNEREELIRGINGLTIAKEKASEAAVKPKSINLKSKLFGRMHGSDMGLNDDQSGCTHKVGYGKVYCQHCGEDVTLEFNPRIWHCPRCRKHVHGAISTAKCIKIH